MNLELFIAQKIHFGKEADYLRELADLIVKRKK